MTSPVKEQIIEAHQPHWSSTWIWITFLGAFIASETGLFFAVTHGLPWLALGLFFLVAHLMHAHLVAFHEAAHNTLCPNRPCNEAMGLFVGTLSFMSLSMYRAAHHYHHAYLATEQDDELWPFVIPGMPRWARVLAACLELTLGIIFTPLLFLRSYFRQGSPARGPALRRRVAVEFGLIVIFWAALMTVTTWLEWWNYVLILYVLPGVLAGNMQSLRKYIEHMGLTGSSVLSSTRSVVASSLGGRLFAWSLFNVSYHGVHHQFARMPQAELPSFSAALIPTAQDDVPPFPSYREAMGTMLASLVDPRVGAQWLAQGQGETVRRKVRIGHPRLHVSRSASGS